MAHAAKANAANTELAHITARTTAQIAAVLDARTEFRVGVGANCLGNLTCLGHVSVLRNIEYSMSYLLSFQ